MSWKKLCAFASLMVTFGATASLAQQPPPQSPNMTFFVVTTGPGKGADLGGLEGADRQCQTLAQNAGAGAKTWRAYLSTQAADGKPASMPATASARGRGRTLRARSLRRTSTICTATTTSWAFRVR